MVKESFIPTGDPNYPLKARYSMPTEDFVAVTGISPDILPATADHVEIGVWTGTDKTGFYEDVKPGKAPQAEVVSADQYLAEISGKGIPVPPALWVPERVIHTRNMEVHSQVDVPADPDNLQGRVLNTRKTSVPVASEGVLFVPGKTTRDYVEALEAAGFPREAFVGQAAPAIVEGLAKGGLAVVRAFGGLRQSPAAEGKLTVVFRTRNNRPTGNPQR